MTQQIERAHQHQAGTVSSEETRCMRGWLVRAGFFIAALVLSLPAQSETYYFHNDHLGTPQVLTDENQTVVWQGDYDPFGKVTETVAMVEQNLRFPGQYYDRESGLHYNYFRTYDPTTGRYTQSDPIGLGGGVNTFSYVHGSPVINIDPFGLFRVTRGLDTTGMTFSDASSAMSAHNMTHQGRAELRLVTLGSRLKDRIEACGTDSDKLMALFDRWVVSIDMFQDRPTTDFSRQSTTFGRYFFDSSYMTSIFYHEFRHTMPQNNDLYGSATDYARGFFESTVSQLPIEKDADSWADQFSRGICTCD